MNKRANLQEKVEKFQKLKKAVLADQPRVVQGKKNIRKLREAKMLVDEVRGILRKVDVREIPDASGRQIKYPRIESVIRDFVIHLVGKEEAGVNRTEARAAYAELRNRLAKGPSPETDVIENGHLLAILLQILLDLQINVESQRAGSLLEEDVEHHIDAAAWRAGLTGTNASELARIRCQDRPGREVRTFDAEVKSVARRKGDIQKRIDTHREEFKNAVTDTLNGALRTVAHDSAEAARLRSALADLASLPSEEEDAMVKEWIVATEVTGTENVFHDIEDLIARLRSAVSRGNP